MLMDAKMLILVLGKMMTNLNDFDRSMMQNGVYFRWTEVLFWVFVGILRLEPNVRIKSSSEQRHLDHLVMLEERYHSHSSSGTETMGRAIRRRQRRFQCPKT